MRFQSLIVTAIVAVFAVCLCGYSQESQISVKTGLDVLLDEKADILKGKCIGIITNHTAVDRQGNLLVDILCRRSEIHIAALFSPEHGIRGDQDDSISDGKDERTGIPVYSLYGKTKKPTPEMLEGMDLLIFDIQDIGARFYTYIGTMAFAMEVAAEKSIPFVVLDRPNPITGTGVEGPVLDFTLRSFIGVAPIAVRHGMTVGELANLFNSEGWLKDSRPCDLTVIPMTGWRRSLWFDETGLPWVQTSPNMPDLETAILYPGLCFLEATTISEGRGTLEPFKMIGAPWIDSEELASVLERKAIPGVRFEPVSFVPKEIIGRAKNPKYEGETCQGVRIQITDRERLKSVTLGIQLLCTVRDLYPERFAWRGGSVRTMELLSGQQWIPKAVEEGESAEVIVSRWQEGLDAFLKIRQKYLLYK